MDVYRHSTGLPTSRSKDANVQQDKGEGLCRGKSLVTEIGDGGYKQQAVFIGKPHRDL